MPPENNRPLRPGDIVELRPAAEILATLDESGALDNMPFMPEMLQYAGRRFTVSRRVEKICDTIAATGSRRVHDTVYLEDLRCDGSGHGGCQAGCRIYWKEAWLRRVDGRAAENRPENGSVAELERRAQASTRTMREIDGEPEEVWRCQATDALKATEQLKTSDLRQYWRELRSGNFALPHFLFALIRGFFFEVADRLRIMKALPLSGPGPTPSRQSRSTSSPGISCKCVRSRRSRARLTQGDTFAGCRSTAKWCRFAVGRIASRTVFSA